jgi:hypothetical protein
MLRMFVGVLCEFDFDVSRDECDWDGLDQAWACRPPEHLLDFDEAFLAFVSASCMSTPYTCLILIFSYFLTTMPYITIFLSHILPGRRGRCRFNQPGKYIKTKQSQLG